MAAAGVRFFVTTVSLTPQQLEAGDYDLEAVAQVHTPHTHAITHPCCTPKEMAQRALPRVALLACLTSLASPPLAADPPRRQRALPPAGHGPRAEWPRLWLRAPQRHGRPAAQRHHHQVRA